MKQARQDYRTEVAAWPVDCLHFIDESGVNLGLTRRYGRAAPGIRVKDTVPFNPSPPVSVIGALSCRGIGAVMSIEGATDGPVFLAYVHQVLAPTLAEGDVVVMDNLSAHQVAGGARPSKRRGPRSSTSRPTRLMSRRSSPVGRKSRPPCAPPRLAPAKLWMRLSPPLWQPLPLSMLETGSPIVVMPYTDLGTALRPNWTA